MMFRLRKQLALWSAILLFQIVPCPVSAQNFGILDQVISTTFEPVTVSALVYDGSRLRQYDAELAPVPSDPGGAHLYRVAATVPLDLKEPPDLRVSFFLVSVDGDFSATPVRVWTGTQIQENTLRVDELERKFADAKKEIPKQQARNDTLERELEQSKERASSTAEVEDILGLQAALDQLKGSDAAAEAELLRLRAIVRAGRAAPESENIQLVRFELSKQLQEVTLATAGTERTRSTKKQSASASYFRKLELARQAEGVDVRALAAQVMQMRQRRTDLEARLGVTAAELAGTGSPEPGTAQEQQGPQSEF